MRIDYEKLVKEIQDTLSHMKKTESNKRDSAARELAEFPQSRYRVSEIDNAQRKLDAILEVEDRIATVIYQHSLTPSLEKSHEESNP